MREGQVMTAEPNYQARVDVTDGRTLLGSYARSARVGGYLAAGADGKRLPGEFKSRTEAVTAIMQARRATAQRGQPKQ
jgi:hypothetical protein